MINKIIRLFVKVLISSLTMTTISEKFLSSLPDSNYIFVTLCGTLCIFMLLLSYEEKIIKNQNEKH